MGAKISTPQGIVMFYNTHVCYGTNVIEKYGNRDMDGVRE